jgi:hypothetical protein
MDAAVIHHDDVIASEHRNQAVFDIGEEHLSGHGTLDHHWGATLTDNWVISAEHTAAILRCISDWLERAGWEPPMC